MIIFKGPSKVDRNPIVCIATGLNKKSGNRKTGDLVQTWILREDISPVDAVKSREDYSICGNCKHRGSGTKRSCYVNYGQAPLNIWRCYQSNKYKFCPENRLTEEFKGKKIRLGSYGDPVAIPFIIWQKCLKKSQGYLGYTHLWKRCAPSYRKYCMASVDSEEEYHQAKKQGWRCFRVRRKENPVLKTEIICPASSEGNYRRQCQNCMACDGWGTNPYKRDISIVVHGPSFKKKYFEENYVLYRSTKNGKKK